MPTVFPQEASFVERGALTACAYIEDGSFPAGLLAKIVGHLEASDREEGGAASGEEGSLAKVFTPIILHFAGECRRAGALGPFGAKLDALAALLALDPIKEIVVAGHGAARQAARRSTLDSMLGAILDVGCDLTHPHLLFDLLPADRERLYLSQVDGANYAMRTACELLWRRTHGLLYALVKFKGTADGRQAVMSCLAGLSNANVGRFKMHVDVRTVSPDRLMHNAFGCLLIFAAPILVPPVGAAVNAKIALVDPNFYALSVGSDVCLADVHGATRMNCSTADYEAAVAALCRAAVGPYRANFVTECFFMTFQYFRLGPIRMIAEYMQVMKSLRQASDAAAALSAAGGAAAAARQAEELKAQSRQLIDAKLILDMALLHEAFMEDCWALVAFTASWLMTVMAGEDGKEEATGGEERISFALLPDFLVDAIGEYALFLSRMVPDFLRRPSPSAGGVAPRIAALLPLIVHLLDRPDLIKNPYVRSKFCDILIAFTPEPASSEETGGALQQPFGQDGSGIFACPAGDDGSAPGAISQLAGKLFRFYIEVESTGASSQFYDKFNIRYNISRIIKCIWSVPGHRRAIVALARDDDASGDGASGRSKSGKGTGGESAGTAASSVALLLGKGDLFIRFSNLLLNDCTFLLDEAMSKLAEIHERQISGATPGGQDGPSGEATSGTLLPSAQPPAQADSPSQRSAGEQEAADGDLEMLERQCQSYLLLANATLDMLDFLTAEVGASFLRVQIIDRLAAMLAFNLAKITGPRCSSLKVANPQRYHWEPKAILAKIVGILLNMARHDAFIVSLARDTRSVSRETFASAAAIMRRHRIRSDADIATFEGAIDRIEGAVREASQLLEDLGEIPDEFLDPLMCTLMEDPVCLSTSGVVVDRATIVAHMLNDAHDPFNRRPITAEDVVPDAALARRIQAFKRGRLEQAAKEGASGDV